MQLILPISSDIIECVYNSEYNSCLQVIKACKARHFDKHFSLMFCVKCNVCYFIVNITYEHLYNK